MNFVQSDEHGLTLTELVLVVALIGLFTGIVAPNFLSNWEDERLNATTKIAVAWLDDLRRKAIQNSVPCRATWDPTNATLSAQCDHETGTSDILNLRAEISNSENLAVNLRAGDPSVWIFTPRGTSTTDGQATLTLTGSTSDPGRCIRLSAPLGLIRMARRRALQEGEFICDYTSNY